MVVDEDSWYPVVVQLCVAVAPSSMGEVAGSKRVAKQKWSPYTDNGQGLDNNLLEGNSFLARIRAALTDRHYYISIFDQHNQYATAYSIHY